MHILDYKRPCPLRTEKGHLPIRQYINGSSFKSATRKNLCSSNRKSAQCNKKRFGDRPPFEIDICKKFHMYMS